MPDKTADKRRKDYEPKTDFQKWLKRLLDANKAAGAFPGDTADLVQEVRRRGVDYTESYIYRIVRGDPGRFENAKRPGYDLAYAIGEIMGDIKSAVTAAGYPIVTESNKRAMPTDEDTLKWLDAYEGLPTTLRPALLEHAMELREIAERAYQQRKDIIGKKPDESGD